MAGAAERAAPPEAEAKGTWARSAFRKGRQSSYVAIQPRNGHSAARKVRENLNAGGTDKSGRKPMGQRVALNWLDTSDPDTPDMVSRGVGA